MSGRVCVCGEALPAEAHFCSRCGKPVEQICDDDAEMCLCGTSFPPEAKFCPGCGRPVIQDVRVEFRIIKENFIGLLAYFIPISGIFLLGVPPFNRDRFIRHHAFQSLYLAGLVAAFLFAAKIFAGVGTILLAAAFAPLWIYCMLRAYRGEMFMLPLIGKWAHDRARRFIP